MKRFYSAFSKQGYCIGYFFGEGKTADQCRWKATAKAIENDYLKENEAVV